MQLGYGYEDANTLRKDPAFEVAVNRSGVQETLASQLTLTRLENGVNLVDLSRMREVFLEFYTDCISLFKPIVTQPDHMLVPLRYYVGDHRRLLAWSEFVRDQTPYSRVWSHQSLHQSRR